VLLRLGRRIRAIDAGSGLTPAELSILGTAVRCGPIRPSDLARREAINPTTLSRLLARLVDAGALCRQDDPADGRGALVSATARGRRLYQQLRAARARALCEHVVRLPASQQRAVSAAIPALEALVELVDGSAR
jgi:DNA-binding MarR family transcriptional regulator